MTKDDTEKNAHQSQPKPRIPKAAMFVGSVVGVGGFGMFAAGGMLSTGFGRLGLINAIIGGTIYGIGTIFERNAKARGED